MAEGPLAGFRILDLTQVVSGPFCSMLLGDLGADVVKVEPPEGDTTRRIGRPRKNGVTASFLNFHGNKRSVVIDLKKEQGRDLVKMLAVRVDAFIENNRPGVAERLGIGYADIRRLNPKIVYCSICGFGPKGRYANAPAYDPVIQCFSSMAALQGRRGGQPTVVKMALADKISGMTAALSIVSALHAARNRGVGQNIRIPMVEAMMAFTDEQFERLCLGVGHHEWWTEVADRTERIRGILRGLAKTLPERTTAEWLEVLEKADVPVGRVNDYETLFTDEEVVANEN